MQNSLVTLVARSIIKSIWLRPISGFNLECYLSTFQKHRPSKHQTFPRINHWPCLLCVIPLPLFQTEDNSFYFGGSSFVMAIMVGLRFELKWWIFTEKLCDLKVNTFGKKFNHWVLACFVILWQETLSKQPGLPLKIEFSGTHFVRKLYLSRSLETLVLPAPLPESIKIMSWRESEHISMYFLSVALVLFWMTLRH